jgi:deoxyhypusine synthase
MIRRGKVHAICCTGANLEEDIFNLVAHDHYVRIPDYREMTAQDEVDLCERGLNRVTDTCIPEHEAMRRLERLLIEEWREATETGQIRAPHEFLWRLVEKGKLQQYYQIDPRDSWVLAARDANLPIFTPGFEDSTCGNLAAAAVVRGDTASRVVECGLDCMLRLIRWYRDVSAQRPIGFYQIGGGIAGDFPICVVPLISQDLQTEVPRWSYFCQISDSTTSYGSYSGAFPTEKISWGKLGLDTPRYVIESDASIVAPLMFAYLLGW